MSAAAVVVAAGRGARFGGERSKVFAPLLGRPLLAWTLAALRACPEFDRFVVVAAPADLEPARALTAEALVERDWQLCAGGAERADSVRAGLARVSDAAELVAIHDGARPLVSPALAERLLAAARERGAAVPALPVTDTLFRGADGGAAAPVERAGLFTVQTPQVFRPDWLREAYERYDPAAPATDDATLVRRAGHPVALVPGDPENLKVTVPEDLERLKRLLLARGEARTGFGYDVHRFAEGRRLFLGGVEIEHPRGLAGHSDADALLHAVCDALLGAAALGDIGQHFPNSDPRYRDIASLELLRDVAGKLREAGWIVVNVDAMVAAEAPKVLPHARLMRERIAAALGTEPERVSVKATTNEGLGAIGRGEGIAAWAVATIRRVAGF